MISGNNGILNKIVQAKEGAKKTSVEERIRLAIQSALTSDYNEYGRITEATLIQELGYYGLIESENDLEVIENGKWELTKEDKKYIIYWDGNLEEKTGKLPLGYKELEYIESTGTQYIDTGIHINNTDNIEICFQNISNNGDCLLFGARTNASSKNCSIYFSNTIELDYGAYNVNRLDFSINNTRLNKHTIRIEANSKCVVDKTELAITEIEFETDYTAYLFYGNGNQFLSNKFYGRIFSCKIGNKRNFIPCVNPQGEIGMFDIVSGTFFENEGTGEFTAGPEADLLPQKYTRLEYIESTGTQYIDTGVYGNENLSIDCGYTMLSTDISYLYGACEAYNTNTYTLSYNKQYDKNYRIFIGSSTPVLGNYNNAFSKLTDVNQAIISTNGVSIDDENYSFTSSTPFDTPYTIALFARNNNGTIDYFAKVRFKYFKMYDNGNLIRNFIPCVNPQGEIGMFDVVSCTFFENRGTEDFKAGLEI